MNLHETRVRFVEWLEQEITEGPTRTPPMPEVQLDIHRRQIYQQLGALAAERHPLLNLQSLPDCSFLRKAA